MANKVIVYSCLSDKIRAALDEGRSFAVMGEIIMFTSAIKVLRDRGFNVSIVSSPAEFIKEDSRGVVYYILDYLTIDHVKHIVLTPQKSHRVRFFCYWGRTPEEIPWAGLKPHQICIPFPYHNKPNTFLGFLMPDLSERGGDTGSTQLNPTIRGYLWGKESKYINTGLIRQLGDAGVQFYSTQVDKPVGSIGDGITNLGLLPRAEYLRLLHHVDYVIGFGDPIAGPTIIETLELGKILIAPRKQIPNFLHSHPNIVLSDDMSAADILNVIRDIEAGHKFKSTEGVKEYHYDSYKDRVASIFPSLPSRRTCIIRSAMNDNNIFHFLVLEIKALWDFISRNNKVDYHIVLTNYDPSLPAHKWRRSLIEAICTKVYAIDETMPVATFDNAIMDIPLQIKGTMIESFKYINYEPNTSLIEMIRRIKTYHLNVGWEADACEGVLLIQRKSGTRILHDSATDLPIETALEPMCREAGVPFKCCYFEEMTFYEQLVAMHRAKWIVAAHGAAETNLIFAGRGATLVEINMRPHWYCDPVCDAHFNKTLRIDQKCKGGLKYHPTYHKADYHNLAKSCGIHYIEIDPISYKGTFIDRNPISKQILCVDSKDVGRAIGLTSKPQ